MSSKRSVIIPVFIPHHGCPHRCVFCDQSAITGISDDAINPEAIAHQIEAFLSSVSSGTRNVQIAFYGGNFLGLEKETMAALLSVATDFVNRGQAGGIRFSTRPDTIDAARISLISRFPVQTVELGVQSMDDRVLTRACRGHLAADTVHAVSLLKRAGYDLGIQLMVGLPGDDETVCFDSARQAAALFPDFVRIYPTVVLKNSPLAALYERGAYVPWSLERTVALATELALFFREKNIPIIRMGLQASEDLDGGSHVLAGPYHPAFGHLVLSKMMFDKALAAIGRMSLDDFGRTAVLLTVHPRSESQLRGLKNENLQKLQQAYGEINFSIKLDEAVSPGEVFVELGGKKSKGHRVKELQSQRVKEA